MSKREWLIFVVLCLFIIGLGIVAINCKLTAKPDVVKLMVTDRYDQKWQGTGVFIRDNLILTAGHVVGNAKVIKVQWPDGTIRLAYDWYEETEADLGLITIRTPQKERKAKFDAAKVGEDAWALGNSLGAGWFLTKGIISAINVPDSYAGQKNMIVTDAGANPGNSGCPLFDKYNNILGICSWHYPYAEGMNYFVDSDICELTLNKYDAIVALWEIE